ncbi:hypothetical protein BDV12DRAFT_207864 [Aspergillus spectabilis]
MSGSEPPTDNARLTLSRSSRSGQASFNAAENPQKFSGGDVWVDTVMHEPEILMHNVTFTPGARSVWHWHEKGQILRVTAGSGWVCDKGELPTRINVGDIVWCPANTLHWHGADDNSYMTHQAITLGKCKFFEAVTDEEYQKKKQES